jgi:hypothetical protein
VIVCVIAKITQASQTTRSGGRAGPCRRVRRTRVLEGSRGLA